MAGGTAAAGATVAMAATLLAEHASRLIVGGLLMEIPPQRFEKLADELDAPVVTGTSGSWLTKKRIYLMPYNGLTFYCKTSPNQKLGLDAIEVPKIDKGPLTL